MPIQIEIQIPIESIQEVTAIKEIKKMIAIDGDRIAWETWTHYQGNIIKKEQYQISWEEMLTNHVDLMIAIEEGLVEETEAIDSMPEGTEEEKKSKADHYGQKFLITTK